MNGRERTNLDRYSTLFSRQSRSIDVGRAFSRDKLRDFGCGGARRSMDEQVFSE